MEWLHKAVAAGFKNVDLLKNQKDFDVLRDRDDFRKMVAELDASELKDKN